MLLITKSDNKVIVLIALSVKSINSFNNRGNTGITPYNEIANQTSTSKN